MIYKNILPKIDSEAFVLESARVIGNVSLAKGANVWFNATVRGDMAGITIGENTNIQDNAVIHTDKSTPTVIGDFVTVGHSAIVHGAKVESGALIGMGAIILNNAVIGEEALIAAGTLVPPGKKVPPRTLAVGSPMRIIRELTAEEIANNHKNALKYVELAKSYING